MTSLVRLLDEPPAFGEAGSTANADALDPSLQRVLRRVRLCARRRSEWLRELWRTEAPGATGRQVTHAEVDAHLDDRDSPAHEADWLSVLKDSADAVALREVESEMAADDASRLARLCRTFALSPIECDVLQACAAAAIDVSLLRVYAYLQDHAGRACVSDALVARLFQHGRTILLDADAPVLRWSIVNSVEAAPGEPRMYVIDPAIRDWLLGSAALDPQLGAIAQLQPEQPPLAEWPLERTVADLHRWLSGDVPLPVRVRIAGGKGSGRRSFAASVAARLGLPLLVIDLDGADASAWPALYAKAQRQAFLDGCSLAFIGELIHAGRLPDTIAHFPLQFVIAETARAAALPPRAIDYLVHLPPLSIESRRALWQAHAPWSAEWPEALRESLLTQHRATPADIARIGARGHCEAAEAAALLRESARELLGELAQRLDGPFERQDLVLPAALDLALDDLLFEAHERVAFWERAEAARLFPQGRGLLALLCGPPGTGKTMTAQVIAAALGMDLFRIDLAAIVSKWVGETSRNLDRVLKRAAHLDVILLFDEADALFGKRTEVKEANDRFANTDTGYLLQAIESYQGIAILASNRKGDIDPAFMRRLRYVLDYPLPGERERLGMWQRVLTELAGAGARRALDADLGRLAAGVEVSGAQIKFAVLNALFSARRDGKPISASHLLRGLERELGKEGRPLTERLREKASSHAE